MANWYVGSVEWTAVTAWAALTSYSVGNLRRQLAAPAVGSERVFRCTTAGVSGASEPTWALTQGSTTSDGTAVWTEVTGQETYQSPGAWGAPHARLANAFGAGWAAAGDNVYVASDHAETQAAAMTVTATGTLPSPNTILCVDQSGSGHVPPQSADLKTTATITTTGNNAITINGCFYAYGLIISCGTTAAGPNSNVATTGKVNQTYNTCAFKMGGTNTQTLIFGSSGQATPTKIILDNTTFQVSNTGSSMRLSGVNFYWKNTPSAIVGGTLSSTLFSSSNVVGSISLFEGVDLSAITGTLFASLSDEALLVLKDCKINSLATITTAPQGTGATLYIARTDSVGNNYRNEVYGYAGTQTTETTIVRTGGASDGTTPVSWKVVTNANTSWLIPFEAMPCAIWNGNPSATVTLEGIWNAAALPNNDDVWFDIEYLGSSSSPLGSFKFGTKANPLAANAALSASTKAWDSLVTARANSHAYSLGAVIAVADNPGRIFFCTTAGTSASSEPGGYSSTVDGGSVTDGGAVFRAGVRFNQAVVLTSPTPAQAGYIYATLRVGKASTTVYIDPSPAVS